MMQTALTSLAISKHIVSAMVLMSLVMLMGCSSITQKDANKDLFEQALVLQDTKSSSSQAGKKRASNRSVKKIVANLDGEIHWTFGSEQVQPSREQRQELFLWLSQLQDYSDNPVLLRLGPDWLSSYKRGNSIRKMIPRGIVIEQQFDTNLEKHKVIFSLKNKLDAKRHEGWFE